MAKASVTMWAWRRRERSLLGWAWLATAVGYLMPLAARWSNAPVFQLADLLPLVLFGLLLVIGHLVFVAAGFKGDTVLFPSVAMLLGIGLISQVRMGAVDWTDWTHPAVMALPAGMAVMILLAVLFGKGKVKILEGTSLLCLLLSLAVLGAILFFGQRFRGAVFLAGNVNPAEIVKLLLAIFLAGFTALFREDLEKTVAGFPSPSPRTVVTFVLLWGMPMALLVMQRDLGMILLLNSVLLVLLFMVTGRWGYLVIGLVGSLLIGLVIFELFPHGQRRLLAWQDPFEDPTGRGWQTLQGLAAMYTGGLWGTGMGSGAPSVIPIAASDFIYAAVAEEIGFAGCGLLLALYLVTIYRGYRIADRLKPSFEQNLAMILVTLLAVQTLLNVGGVTKAIPLTGITLPFISRGGSSMVTSLAMIGLLLALSDSGSAVSSRSTRANRGGKKKRRRKR